MEENYVWKIAGIDIPRIMTFNESTKEVELVDGISLKIFKIFQEKLHFRYKFVQPLQKTYLHIYDNGTYEGMIGQIMKQEADLSYDSYPIENDLYNLSDYSTFAEIDSTGFMSVRRKQSLNWDTIAKPFSFQIWTAIFISLFFVGFITSLLMRYEQKLIKTTKFWSFKKTIWYLFGTCAGQGSNLDSITRFPSRFVLGVWLLTAFILSSAYSQILMSFMTAPIHEQVPKTIHQLATAVEAGRITCGTFDILTRVIFKDSISGDAKILKDHIEEYHVSEVNTIYNRIENDRFAFLSPKTILDKMKINVTGRVMINEDSLSMIFTSFHMRKGFPYKKKIDKIVAHLHESGIIDHLNNKRKRIPFYINNHEIHPLNLQELLGCFLLLIVGYMLSAICFIGEIIANCRIKSVAVRK